MRIAAAFVFLLVPVLTSAQQPQAPLEPMVSVSGVGLVQAVPDRAWVTISAESRASSAREAQRRNTEAMNPVLAKLKGAGLPEDAIKTIGYDVQQEWDFVEGRRVNRGFVARNTVEVRIDTVDRVGEFLELAGTSGATSLGGIRFDLKDRARLEREALRLAAVDARGKLDAAAAGAGAQVGRIIRIEEFGLGNPIPLPSPVMLRREMAVQGAAADASAPISAGQTEIRAQVTLTATLR